MSNIDPTITHTDVIPVLQTEVFNGHPDAQFATGFIGYGDEVLPGFETARKAYHELRAKVYVGQTRMLHPIYGEGGSETDPDDLRSAHIVTIENTGETQRLVACMRLIHGGELGRLPIENFFPETSFTTPSMAGTTPVEVSRYIARHEDPAIQDKLSWKLFGAGLAYVMQHRLGPTFGVVEPKIENQLAERGVPLRRIADPKWVAEYNDHNLGIVIYTDRLAELMERRSPGSIYGVRPDQIVFSGTIRAAERLRAAAS